MSNPIDNIAGVLVTFCVAVSTIGTWLAETLPSLAAAASIAWIGWQWYHSAPMKEIREARRAAKKLKSTPPAFPPSHD